MRQLSRLTVAFVVALVALVASPAAMADSAVIADTGQTPWDGDEGTVTPIEARAAEIATAIAGRAVTVRCVDDVTWAALLNPWGKDPTSLWGYADRVAPFTVLAPRTCTRLQEFALATPKPTKCATVKTVERSVTRTERVKVRRRVKVNGRWVWRSRWVTKTFDETELVDETVHVACYVNGRSVVQQPPEFWLAYWAYAVSLTTLAHEAYHLGGVPNEDRAECFALQNISRVAAALGADDADGRAIASYYFDYPYKSRQTHSTDYWSPECRDGGALDLNPSSTLWPTP